MWQTIKHKRALHVLPVDEDHELSVLCSCDPGVEVENGVTIVIHDAFDGRVGLEMAQEILNHLP